MATTPLTWDGSNAQGQPLRWDSGLTWDASAPQSTPIRMPRLRVLLNFAYASDHALEQRANNVHTKLYVATVPYPSPPVTAANLLTGITSFSSAVAATAQGGTQATADKNSARAVLVDLLRQLANYVQGRHNNDLATLLLSGFEAASTNQAQTELATPDITKIVNKESGQVQIRSTAIRNAKSYEIEFALLDAAGTPGPWQEGPTVGSTRELFVQGLTPGAAYLFRIRAVGGSTQYSIWSNPVVHRCV